MRTTITEHEGCFAFDYMAENMVEAALLARIAMNSTQEIRFKETFVNKDGSFQSSIVIAKHKRANNCIPKRK
jgi:hypothetical protein